MTGDIGLILLKSQNCGHCVSFTPIFEKAMEKKICKFNILDTVDENTNTILKNDYPGIINKFDGAVPTIYLMVGGKVQEIKSSKIKDGGKLDDAVSEFIKNVKDGIKTLKSPTHTTYVQTGGYKNEEYYKKKYIKYKTKYLQEKIK
jgi:thiol-disulfide isomerase/thioredoxin